MAADGGLGRARERRRSRRRTRPTRLAARRSPAPEHRERAAADGARLLDDLGRSGRRTTGRRRSPRPPRRRRARRRAPRSSRCRRSSLPHGERVQRAGAAAIGPAATRGRRLLDPAPRLAERLLERAADRHDLAHGLHRRAEHRRGLRELLEREPRDLHDHVVERRLERGGRLAGDVVRDLVEPVADREQRRDLRDREAGGLRGQRRAPRDTRGFISIRTWRPVRGVDGELDVGPARLDADHAEHLDRGVAHRAGTRVGQRLLRRDRDRVAGVHTHRVDVLDRADDHRVVGAVAHHLELELLPARDRLLDRGSRRPGSRRAHGPRVVASSLAVGGEAAPAAAERERGAHDHRVADLAAERERLVDGGRDARPRHLEARSIIAPGNRCGPPPCGSPRATRRSAGCPAGRDHPTPRARRSR